MLFSNYLLFKIIYLGLSCKWAPVQILNVCMGAQLSGMLRLWREGTREWDPGTSFSPSHVGGQQGCVKWMKESDGSIPLRGRNTSTWKWMKCLGYMRWLWGAPWHYGEVLCLFTLLGICSGPWAWKERPLSNAVSSLQGTCFLVELAVFPPIVINVFIVKVGRFGVQKKKGLFLQS